MSFLVEISKIEHANIFFGVHIMAFLEMNEQNEISNSATENPLGNVTVGDICRDRSKRKKHRYS